MEWWAWVAVGLVAWAALSLAVAGLWVMVARKWKARRRRNRRRERRRDY